jgi:hypothetical protein
VSYIDVQDFKIGLDRRRRQATGVPGSLWECINCHITSGAEIEKRKAFVVKYTVTTDTFGLHAAAGNLYVFGSAVSPSVPPGITYQRLQHPDSQAMSELLSAENFDGKIYAIAKYADGSIHHFYDGVRVAAWDDGIVRSGMVDNSGIATHLAALIDPDVDVSASAVSNIVTVTGPASGAAFTITAEALNGGATNNQTAVVATTTPAIPGIAEVLAIGTFRITGGVPNVIATGNVTLTGGASGSINSVTVNGVTITSGVVNFNTTLSQTATDLAANINAHTSSPDYTAVAVGTVVTISAAQAAGADPNGFIVVANTTTITATTGNMAGGVTNAITSVKVDGVEILSTRVNWLVSNSGTATNVASQITSFSSSPEYTATASSETVTVSAVAGSGASPNGKSIAILSSNPSVTAVVVASPMSGGVAAVSGQQQVSTVTIGGTFEAGDRFTVTINGRTYGASGNPTIKGNFAKTYKGKVYVTAGSLAQFCAVNAPTKWRDSEIGAGFINMANNDSGSVPFNGTGVYQGNLAFFSDESVQTWFVDADDARNTILQVLNGTGTRSPKTIRQYANQDLFYLDSSGMRSLRARDSSNNAYSQDIGVAIDPILVDEMKALGDTVTRAATTTIEPIDKRLWLALGNNIYVLSFFEGSRISAWSTYTIGVQITDFAVLDKRVYARAGTTIYLYGGDNNETYDSSEARITFPFLTVGRVADDKIIRAYDIAADQNWDIWLLSDPRNLARKRKLGSISSLTQVSQEHAAAGLTSHFAPQLISTAAAKAWIGNLQIHYDRIE